MIGGLKGHTYEDRLREVGLQSLEDRRSDADLVMVYKVLTGKVRVNNGKWFELAAQAAQQPTRTAADPLRLRKPRARLDIREKFFTVRVVDGWNNLPLYIRAAPTVARFRAALRRHIGASVPGMNNQHLLRR